MKKIILVTLFGIVLMASQAQQFTVIDTLAANDYKHKIVTERLVKMIEDVERAASAEKGSGEISFKDETVAFIGAINMAYVSYTESLMLKDTLIYEKIGNDYYLNGNTLVSGIVSQYFAIQNEIQVIDDDDEILYKDAVSGIKERREKQSRLKKIYDQIISQQ